MSERTIDTAPRFKHDHGTFAIVMRGDPVDAQSVVDYLHVNTELDLVYMKSSRKKLQISEE